MLAQALGVSPSRWRTSYPVLASSPPISLAAALEVAHRNAVRHDVAERIEFAERNLLDGLATNHERSISSSAILPTSAAGKQPHCKCEVRAHEPESALFAETGTELYASDRAGG